MANVNEGLETPEAAENVNTAAGFEAALATKGVAPEEGENSSDTSIASGLQVAEPGQSRDTEGRFAAADATPKPDTSAQTTEADQPVALEVDDPQIQEFLAKYGGDPVKALKAATEQSSLLGRQGNELGQTREELAELRGRLDALTQAQAATPAVHLSDDQVEEQVSAAIQQKGYASAATEAANAAHASGDERSYRSIMEQWQLEDPMSAMDFNTDFRMWQRDQRQAAAAKEAGVPAWQTTAEEQAQERAMGDAIAHVATELGAEAWATIGPHMMQALDEVPPRVAAMISSADPQERIDGTKLVADRAQLISMREGVSTPEGEGTAQTTTTEQRKLSGARVVSSGLRPVAAAPTTHESVEEATKAFKKELMETETTSVASGLTYGK